MIRQICLKYLQLLSLTIGSPWVVKNTSNKWRIPDAGYLMFSVWAIYCCVWACHQSKVTADCSIRCRARGWATANIICGRTVCAVNGLLISAYIDKKKSTVVLLPFGHVKNIRYCNMRCPFQNIDHYNNLGWIKRPQIFVKQWFNVWVMFHIACKRGGLRALDWKRGELPMLFVPHMVCRAQTELWPGD